MYIYPVLGEDQGLIRVLEGKLARLTQKVPTLHIDHIPAVMQEPVVGVPPIWICLMRQVARAVLVYIDVVEVAEDRVDIGPDHPTGNPCMCVCPILGED